MSADRSLRILAVHQGAELYGSDRSFLQCVQGLREGFPDAEIVVELGADGPLRHALEPVANMIAIVPLAVARRSDGWFSRLRTICRAGWRAIHKRDGIARYDVVYINTIVVLDYLLALLIWRSAGAIVHVREIPGVGFADRALQWLLIASGAALVFNSHATRKVFAPPPSRLTNVVHNGVGPATGGIGKECHKGFNILMAGRLMGWKGQDLLFEALALWDQRKRIGVAVRIVGSGFGDDGAEARRLKALAAQCGLAAHVRFVGFAENMDDHYRWADVLVMPSRRPEPFGRVVIEAMAHGCAVVAADHGGLPEIVLAEQTGLLFEPNNPRELSNALARLRDIPALRAQMGRMGRTRQRAIFSETVMKAKLASFVLAVLNGA